MSLLSKKQSIGYILKSFSETDFLTLDKFILAAYYTLSVHKGYEDVSIEDMSEFTDRITEAMELSMDQHIQVKMLLERIVSTFNENEAEEFYNEFVTDNMIDKFYK